MAKTVSTHCQICITNRGLEIQVDEASNRALSIAPDRQNLAATQLSAIEHMTKKYEAEKGG